MKEAIAFLPLASMVLGIISTAGGFFLYYSGSVRKRYAAERDFQHLKRNQEQIVQLLNLLHDDISDLQNEMIRLTEQVRKP